MYQFNGKEKQDELDLGWNDYGARMYMPENGRWALSDLLAEKYYPLRRIKKKIKKIDCKENE